MRIKCKRQRLPYWLKTPLPRSRGRRRVESLLQDLSLSTICSSALCPNLKHCYSRGTATFLLLGPRCTRRCSFCSVEKGEPLPPCRDEGERIAEAARRLRLRYVVLTSVTRDDLPDGGSRHFLRVLLRLKGEGIRVEALTPDFQGKREDILRVLEGGPAVVAHNLETVSRLYPYVRPQADYKGSLALLAAVKEKGPSGVTKSGVMVGLGEEKEEILNLLRDLRAVGCDILTVGQYLRPTNGQVPVHRYWFPGEFQEIGEAAEEMGFAAVCSFPLARSSYRAEEAYLQVLSRRGEGA